MAVACITNGFKQELEMGYFWEGGVTIDIPINDYLHLHDRQPARLTS